MLLFNTGWSGNVLTALLGVVVIFFPFTIPYFVFSVLLHRIYERWMWMLIFPFLANLVFILDWEFGTSWRTWSGIRLG